MPVAESAQRGLRGIPEIVPPTDTWPFTWVKTKKNSKSATILSFGNEIFT